LRLAQEAEALILIKEVKSAFGSLIRTQSILAGKARLDAVTEAMPLESLKYPRSLLMPHPGSESLQPLAANIFQFGT
jgi:hypothetical protein